MKKLIGILLLTLVTQAHAASAAQDANFGFLDLLIWQFNEAGSENWAERIEAPGLTQSGVLLSVPFHWNTGVRAGIGHRFSGSEIDVKLVYTNFKTQASDSATGFLYSPFDGNYFANNTNGAQFGPSYRGANVSWHVNYNTLDLQAGRSFQPSNRLALHPFVGLKAATINQAFNTNWLNPVNVVNFTVASEDLKNNFAGIGPSFGVDSTWSLYQSPKMSLNLLGNIATALLVGHWNFNEIYTNNAPTTINVNVSSVNAVSPYVGGLMGLEWLNHLDRADVRVRLAYEGQVWFNQLQFYSLDMGRTNHLLSVQGSDLEFLVNF